MAHSKRAALVTGANKGIGFEIARQLGKEGFDVFLGARDAGLGENAAAKLKSEGINAQFVLLDLNRHETFAEAASAIQAGATNPW